MSSTYTKKKHLYTRYTYILVSKSIKTYTGLKK